MTPQTDQGHPSIEQEGRPRHVAAILQDGDEHKEDENLRQENQDRSDTRDHAVHKQALQSSGRYLRCKPDPKPAERTIDRICRTIFRRSLRSSAEGAMPSALVERLAGE